MKKSRRNIIILGIILLLLFIGIAFRAGITTYAVFSADLMDFPLYDYVMMILFAGTIVTIFNIRLQLKTEYDIGLELKKFKVDNPNISIDNLKTYILYCLSKGREDTRIKEILVNAGWEMTLIDEALENIESKR
jgi:hypothetical protein